jgi:hypothetical protein
MMNIIYCLFIALIPFVSSYGQNVDQIVSGHIKAIGGAGVLDSIRSIRYETVVHAMGADAASNSTILNGKGARFESDINGVKIIQVFTDKSGWSVNPMSGQDKAQIMDKRVIEAGRDQIDIGGPLYLYKQKGNSIILKDENDSLYILAVTMGNGTKRLVFLSRKSSLIVKTVQTIYTMGKNMEITKLYENYQKAENGYIYPEKETDWYENQFAIITEVKSVQINPEVDEKIFLFLGEN